MNLKQITKISDAVSNQTLTKLVTAFLTAHRKDAQASFPFSAEGVAGDVAKADNLCTFTFYKADNKVLTPPVVVTVTLPKGGTDAEVVPAVTEEIETQVNKKQVTHPTKMETLKTKLGELTEAVGNQLGRAASAVVSAVKNVKVEKF